MYWATGHDRRRDAAGPNRTRRLIVAVGLALAAAVGTAALDSAIKSHGAPEPVAVATAAAAYSAGLPAATSTVPPVVKSSTPHPAAAPATTAPPTTAAPATTTTVKRPAAPSTTASVTEQHAVATALATRSTTPAAPALASADTCAAALSYLSAHSAPGFGFECPGYALGHQAMTCIDVSGVCPGAKLIVISVVCPASYMNEAHNSWVLSGLQSGSIDPYGYCH